MTIRSCGSRRNNTKSFFFTGPTRHSGAGKRNSTDLGGKSGYSALYLMEQADACLYEAKARGRNRVEVAGEERRKTPTIMQTQAEGK